MNVSYVKILICLKGKKNRMNKVLYVAAGIMMIVDLLLFTYADVKEDEYRALKYLMLAIMMSTIVLMNMGS